MAVIEVEGLHKEFRHLGRGRTVAVDGLDLSVPEGGVFAHAFEVLEKGAAPVLRVVVLPVLLNQPLKCQPIVVHDPLLCR